MEPSDDVILTRVAGEKDLKGGQQDDERSRVAGASQPADHQSELAVEVDRLGGAAMALDRGARSIGGKVEPRQLT